VHNYAIRTGSADFSHLVLAASWVKQGYKGDDGYLTRDGKKIAVKEEEDLFNERSEILIIFEIKKEQ